MGGGGLECPCPKADMGPSGPRGSVWGVGSAKGVRPAANTVLKPLAARLDPVCGVGPAKGVRPAARVVWMQSAAGALTALYVSLPGLRGQPCTDSWQPNQPVWALHDPVPARVVPLHSAAGPG